MYISPHTVSLGFSVCPEEKKVTKILPRLSWVTLLSTLRATCGTVPDLMSVEGEVEKVTGYSHLWLGEGLESMGWLMHSEFDESCLRASILNSLHQLSDHVNWVIILSLPPIYSFEVVYLLFWEAITWIHFIKMLIDVKISYYSYEFSVPSTMSILLSGYLKSSVGKSSLNSIFLFIWMRTSESPSPIFFHWH